MASSAGKCLFVVAVALLNPFDLVGWSFQRSHDVWEQLNASCYGNFDCRRSESGRDLITVVTLDEDTIRRASLSSPLSLRDLEDAIDEIVGAPGTTSAEHQPSALVIDLLLSNDDTIQSGSLVPISDQAEITACEGQPLAPDPKKPPKLSRAQCLVEDVARITHYGHDRDQWSDPHCQSNVLAKLVCIRESGGVPVLFADAGPTGHDADGRASTAEPELLRTLGEVAAVVPVKVDTMAYPMASRSAAGSVEGFTLSPAAALFAAWCLDRDRGEVCPQLPGRVDKAVAWPDAFNRPIDVAWGVARQDAFVQRTQALFGDTFGARCRPPASTVMDSAGVFLTQALRGLAGPNAETPCPYNHALPLETLQMSPAREDLTQWFGGKLVLVGGQFQASGDWLPAAPFGQVPGVFYHAMALDNLIKDGGDYPKPAAPVFTGKTLYWDDYPTLAAIFLVTLMAGIARMTLNSAMADPRRPDGKRFRAWFWRFATLVGTGLLILALLRALGGVIAVPSRFNYVAVTLVCLAGVLEITGHALLGPLWAWVFAHWPHFNPEYHRWDHHPQPRPDGTIEETTE